MTPRELREMQRLAQAYDDAYRPGPEPWNRSAWLCYAAWIGWSGTCIAIGYILAQ